MNIRVAMVAVGLLSCALRGQDSAFDAASIKLSQHPVGRDFYNRISISGAGLRGPNVTLKRLIEEAYSLQPYQVSGGPKWLDSSEYEIEARAGQPISREQLRLMLRSLLAERFRLSVHRDKTDLRVLELVVDRNGPKIRPVKDPEEPSAVRFPEFRGTLQEFANILSVQLSIVTMDDPTKPGLATGGPVPVIDKTGLTGIYAFHGETRAEAGADMINLWQRVLQDQLGLRLENRRTSVEVLVVERAERVPVAN